MWREERERETQGVNVEWEGREGDEGKKKRILPKEVGGRRERKWETSQAKEGVAWFSIFHSQRSFFSLSLSRTQTSAKKDIY